MPKKCFVMLLLFLVPYLCHAQKMSSKLFSKDVLQQTRVAENSAPDQNTTNAHVGATECIDCHAGPYVTYKDSVHGKKMDSRSPAGMLECESCHGPASKHVEAEENTNEEGKLVGPIVTFGLHASTPMEQQNEICLQCHSTSKLHLFWQGSTHQQRGIGCVNCHQVHGKNVKLLSKPSITETCFQCHLKEKAEVQMPFHHPIREGKMTCTDCHNPHGSTGPKLLSVDEINEKCYECHADKRGPFLYEHPPAAENCLNCHTPHGSTHDFLLVARTPWLCQRCHDGEGHKGILYTSNMFPPTTASSVYQLRPQLYGRSCWQCHVTIHGSNSASGETFLR